MGFLIKWCNFANLNSNYNIRKIYEDNSHYRFINL